MKRVFISVPMRGKTNEEIEAAIVKLHQLAEIFEGERLKRVDNYDPDIKYETNKDKIHGLSKSIDKMAECDIVIGVDSFSYEGCNAEMDVAIRYGIKRYTVPYSYIFGEPESIELVTESNDEVFVGEKEEE